MKLSFRIWILIACIMFSLIAIFSIPPTFMEKGVLVKSVKSNTTIFDSGLRVGDIILYINNKKIENTNDYSTVLTNVFSENKSSKIIIKTKNKEIIDIFSPEIKEYIEVENIPKTRIKTGLDIQGGARALVTAENQTLTDSQLDDLISISQQRLNIYGLSDVTIRKVTDLSGNKFMLVEIAGSNPADLENLIAQQGKFEAKIGNDSVFTGGNQDITYVARTGQQSGIYSCDDYQGGSACTFRFAITLSEEAANRHAEITNKLGINASNPEYLDKQLDLYLDDQLFDSLYIGRDLKGSTTTQISISGPGRGTSREEAYKNAVENMKKLQTVLITGSLPFKLKIEKTDKISPVLGEQFTKAILIGGLFAILAVSFIIFLRYRQIKISLALLLVSFSEVLIILGIASLIKWNLDLPSIAGIIATIGTGVDCQIIILDESKFRIDSLKQRIKKALFIIFTAFATAAVSLIPLTGFLSFMGINAAGAGLLKGFAVTTLIGITAGVFITRPAFSEIVKMIVKE
jgi:preprotein translocase subunit SecD